MNTSKNPVAIVGPQYCSPYQKDLTINRKRSFGSPSSFVVTDDTNNIIFNVESVSSFSNKRVIFDAAGNPILTLFRSLFTGTWKAYRGESTEEKDLIFKAKGSAIFHPKTKYNVYKADNFSQDVPDFKVKGSYYQKGSMAIYAGESFTTIVAQIFSDTWKAYRGESSDENDLIFSTKGAAIFHPKTKFRVYKANNSSSKDVPDFKVKGSLNKKASMAIYVGDSSTIVAQVQNKLSNLEFSWKKTVVTVYANIDQAFVAAMMVLLSTLLISSSGASMNSASSAGSGLGAAMN